MNAAPVALRGGVAPLSISVPGHLWPNDDDYLCGTSSLDLYGFFPPFTVDAIQAPYDEDIKNQTVLSALGEGLPGGRLPWTVDILSGVSVALRATDAGGRIAYSATVNVLEGDPRVCQMTAVKQQKNAVALQWILAIVVAVPSLYLSIVWVCTCAGYSRAQSMEFADGLDGNATPPDEHLVLVEIPPTPGALPPYSDAVGGKTAA
ncbi:hypothetical protein JCM10213_004565 [Rhodosporidiobolus nylandii]